MPVETNRLPIINVRALISGLSEEKRIVAKEIGDALRDYGFFYVTGHGIDETLQQRLEDLSKEFFKQPLEEKEKTKMESAARRGYVSIGRKFTSGKLDLQESLCFGEESFAKNIFPEIPNFRETVTDYIAAVKQLCDKLMEAIAISLELNENYFDDNYTKDSRIGFRILHYPKITEITAAENSWGVGEHTDCGFLTIIKQDTCGGLQVKHKSNWIEATPVHNAFVCNIGDMLAKMTGGLYKSTLHRVKSPSLNERFSFPFVFYPDINCKVNAIESVVSKHGICDDKDTRWDGESLHQFDGTFGEYLQKHKFKQNVISKAEKILTQ